MYKKRLKVRYWRPKRVNIGWYTCWYLHHCGRKRTYNDNSNSAFSRVKASGICSSIFCIQPVSIYTAYNQNEHSGVTSSKRQRQPDREMARRSSTIKLAVEMRQLTSVLIDWTNILCPVDACICISFSSIYTIRLQETTQFMTGLIINKVKAIINSLFMMT
jgi:hypothetical protein